MTSFKPHGSNKCCAPASHDDDIDDYDDDDNDDDVAIDGDDDDIVCRICACPAVSIPRQILVISKWYLARQINVQMS